MNRGIRTNVRRETHQRSDSGTPACDDDRSGEPTVRPSSDRSDAGRGTRGQSNVIAVVLLLGMVLMGASLTAYVGAGVLGDLQTTIHEEDAEQTVREVDSRLTEVALGDNLEHTLAFDASDDQRVRVKDDAEMEIQLGSCDTFEIPMGSIHYETEDGATVTYQGGGIWRTNPAGNNSMVSPPDMEYRDGTVTFPAVNINGSVNGSVETLQARKDLAKSRARSEEYSETMADCVGASNMTIRVTSRYADAWGDYLERQVSENVTYDLGNLDPDDDSVTARISNNLDLSPGNSDDNVTVDRNSTIDVEVLGTEVSSESCWGDCTKQWIPVSMGIYADDEPIEHDWGDPLVDESCTRRGGCTVHNEIRNLNNQGTQLEVWPRSFEVEPEEGEEVAITISATSWWCDDWEWTESDSYNGEEYDHYDCENLGDQLDTADASKNDNPDQVRALGDGDQVPVLESGNRQRNAKEVLGSKINETGHLQLAPNQFVFLFEITNPPHTRWEDAGKSRGDPNYNDAIALLEIENQEGRETSGNDFQIRLSMNEVVIEPADG